MQTSAVVNAVSNLVPNLAPGPDLMSSAIGSLDTIGGSVDAANAPEVPFADLIRKSIDSEQKLEHDATSTVEGLMRGDGVDVHQAMIATQKANLGFEMALAVRNKAVAAYQSVMQMQF